ncbi:TIGR03557 family F420-dependent LLM class oxidoreductase [Methanoculleus sp. FWC-SCC1]|uniref:TIGR03557 family F420-dependent LLM class oxidoreductase n=1 Tax=Methanoculleus frigidifontis TaxID=2584085 RepID=A0ABT8MCX5_9EURY|nr:TIGR03557 family F420-dependent LLM class oxidoreductase [Methanoculleus sp. FWC-SCC1]MDN7025800.1 TIGR03557 family F420-dependent LLM class oxidoreductase [Methanoculleus sp. FWC-SCC1]
MVEIGYKLFTEAHNPLELVQNAKQAEAAGFSFVNITDHYHPWTGRQGHAGFAWTIIGAVAGATEQIPVSTGITCPTIRYHPAIVAQAAATAAVMLPGRFELGVGTGEALNEHITGACFPSSENVRLAMLREAVDIIRTLWSGGMHDYYGAFYMIDNAQVFELPESPPRILMAAQGTTAAQTAGDIADGLIHFEQMPGEVLDAFRSSGGEGKPAMLEFAVCYDRDERRAKEIAYAWFPVAANQGELNWVMPTPTHFEELAKMVTPDDVAQNVLCTSEARPLIDKIGRASDMGYDRVVINQVGPNQQEFITFMRDNVLPEFGLSAPSREVPGAEERLPPEPAVQSIPGGQRP